MHPSLLLVVGLAVQLVATAAAPEPGAGRVPAAGTEGASIPGQEAPQPPAWVVDGVPDTVWLLVEATYAEEDGDRAKEMLREAEVHARTSLAEDSTHVGRRFALAVVLGRRADIEGGRTKVLVASDFHVELEAVLAADPEHPQARHLMGRLYAGVRRMSRITRWIATNLLGGGELKKATWEAAEEHLAFAEQALPGVADHHLQLANLYRDTDRPEQALVEVEHVLAIPARTPLELAVREEALGLRDRLEDGGERDAPAEREGQGAAWEGPDATGAEEPPTP